MTDAVTSFFPNEADSGDDHRQKQITNAIVVTTIGSIGKGIGDMHLDFMISYLLVHGDSR